MPSAQHHQPDLDAAQATYRPHDYIDALAPLAPYFEGHTGGHYMTQPDSIGAYYQGVPLEVACQAAAAFGHLDTAADNKDYARLTLRSIAALAPKGTTVDLQYFDVSHGETWLPHGCNVGLAPFGVQVPDGPEQDDATDAIARLTAPEQAEDEEWQANITGDGLIMPYC